MAVKRVSTFKVNPFKTVDAEANLCDLDHAVEIQFDPLVAQALNRVGVGSRRRAGSTSAQDRKREQIQCPNTSPRSFY